MTALPSSLVDYRGALEDAAARDLHRRRRTTPVRRLAAVGAAALAVVLAVGAVNLVTGGGPSVVDRAAAALTPSAAGVFHLRIVGTETDGGSSRSWTSEAWVSTTRPYAERQVETGPSGRLETALADGLMQAYDPATNTIYEASKQALAAGKQDVKQGAPVPEKARGAAGTAKDTPPAGKVEPKEPAADATASPWDAKFRDSVLSMLRSGDARVEGHVAVDGRDALRIVATSPEGTSTYLVDASTYDPIRWTTTGPAGSSSLDFQAYELLPSSGGSQALVSLQAQHPGARVSRDAAAYAAFVAEHKALEARQAARNANQK